MDTIKFIFSTGFGMAITIIALVFSKILGSPANPHDLLAPALEPIKQEIITNIPVFLGVYWIIFFILGRTKKNEW